MDSRSPYPFFYTKNTKEITYFPFSTKNTKNRKNTKNLKGMKNTKDTKVVNFILIFAKDTKNRE